MLPKFPKKLLSKETVMWAIIIYFVWKFLLRGLFPAFDRVIEGFHPSHSLSDCGDCPQFFADNDECHYAAQVQCGITNDQFNNCWLPRYRMCIRSSPGDQPIVNCHRYATKWCGNIPGPEAGCFAEKSQKCMAAKGYSADPDQCHY